MVGPVLEDVHNNNFSQSTNSPVLSHTSGNEDNVVASLPNNSEEPVPVEPQSAPVIIQWQALEPDTIPITTPVQDTNCQMMSDHSFIGSGEILQSFPLELFGDFYQYQSHPPDEPPPLSPSVPVIIPLQESHGHNGSRRLSSSHQAVTVDGEEQFVVSPEILPVLVSLCN